MKKTIFFVIINLLIITGVNAQENKKFWNEGKLSWADFKDTTGTQTASELNYYFGFKKLKENFTDTVFTRFKAIAFIYKNSSWVNKNLKSKQNLQFNQIIFNILELHRRILQKEIDTAKLINVADIFNQEAKNCNTEISKFKMESFSGKNKDKITEWNNKINKQLSQINDPKVPDFKKSKITLKGNIGLGSEIYSGNLSNYFPICFNFSVGAGIVYKKSNLLIDEIFTSGKLKQDLVGLPNWNKEAKVSFTKIFLSYGYNFDFSQKIKITPFAGLGTTIMSTQSPINQDSTISQNSFNLIWGVNIDYLLSNNINFIFKKYSQTFIETKFYILNQRYSKDLKGLSFNFSIGVSIFGNYIRH